MAERFTRRSFMGRVAGQTAVCTLGMPLLSRSALGHGASPNEKIGLGFVGVGGMGNQHLRVLLRNPEVHVRAVCDVFEPHRLKA